MRTVLEAAEKGHERAALAIEIFCYVLAKQLAGLVVALGRLDALVFTGGIGENAAALRARIVEGAAWLGMQLDVSSNAAGAGVISSRGSAVRVLVLRTDEEAVIAAHTARQIAAAAA